MDGKMPIQSFKTQSFKIHSFKIQSFKKAEQIIKLIASLFLF